MTMKRTQIFLVTLWLSHVASAMVFHYFRFMIHVICVTLSLYILISTLCHLKMYALYHHQVTVQPHFHQEEQRGVNLLYIMWCRNKVISATSIHTYITLFSKAGQEYATYKLMWTYCNYK